MSDVSQIGRSNLRKGAVYMLIGLIWGMAISSTPFPRLIQLTAHGIMFLVAGAIAFSIRCKGAIDKPASWT